MKPIEGNFFLVVQTLQNQTKFLRYQVEVAELTLRKCLQTSRISPNDLDLPISAIENQSLRLQSFVLQRIPIRSFRIS
jgi:hypothetical protein